MSLRDLLAECTQENVERWITRSTTEDTEMPKTKYPSNPLPCGCKAVGVVDLGSYEERPPYKHMFVRFCPLHQAAGEMLEALKDLCDHLCPPNHTEATVGANFGGKMQMSYRKARAAITKATRTGG